jgi:hypothetical protein
MSDQGPPWLRCLRVSSNKDDALACARAYGAPDDVLEFLEALPFTLFASERGVQDALAALTPHSKDEEEGEEISKLEA